MILDLCVMFLAYFSCLSAQAGLKNVEFDGYLKHFKPSQRYVEERQKLFAQNLIKRFPNTGNGVDIMSSTSAASVDNILKKQQ